MQELAKREQDRRDLDAWLTVQRLKRAQGAVDTTAARRAKIQGRDWRDPERGVEIGMERQVGRGSQNSTGSCAGTDKGSGRQSCVPIALFLARRLNGDMIVGLAPDWYALRIIPREFFFFFLSFDTHGDRPFVEVVFVVSESE